jgi:tetratricopeptide (TPR) repeat protein
MIDACGPVDYYQLVHAMVVYEPGQKPADPSSSTEGEQQNQYQSSEEIQEEKKREKEEHTSSSTSSDPPPPPPPSDQEPSETEKVRNQHAMRDATECGFSLQQLIAIWKLGEFDPYIFYNIKARLLVLAPHIYEEERAYIGRCLQKTYGQFINVGEDEDLPFELGRIAYQWQIEQHNLALFFYYESIKHFGEHHITYYNIALCYSETARFKRALKYLKKSLEMDPSYEPAEHIRSEIIQNILRTRLLAQENEGEDQALPDLSEFVISDDQTHITYEGLDADDFELDWEDVAAYASPEPSGPFLNQLMEAREASSKLREAYFASLQESSA